MSEGGVFQVFSPVSVGEKSRDGTSIPLLRAGGFRAGGLKGGVYPEAGARQEAQRKREGG